MSLAVKGLLSSEFLDSGMFTFLSLEEAHTQSNSQYDGNQYSSSNAEKDDVDLNIFLFLNKLFSGAIRCGTDSRSSSAGRGDSVLLNSIIPFESRSLLLVRGCRFGSSGTSKTVSAVRFTSSILLGDTNVFTASISTENRSAKVYISSSQLLSELLAQGLESPVRVFIVIFSLDEEVNDDGTLIDCDHFDGAGMDSKHCGNSISKLNCTSVSIERIQSPVETHFTLDRVFGFDSKFTTRSQVEF